MVKVAGDICIFMLLSEPEDACVKWMFLLIWDVSSFSALEAVSRTGENCENTSRPAEITAPVILMAFIWFFINIQYEYHVSTHRNII